MRSIILANTATSNQTVQQKGGETQASPSPVDPATQPTQDPNPQDDAPNVRTTSVGSLVSSTFVDSSPKESKSPAGDRVSSPPPPGGPLVPLPSTQSPEIRQQASPGQKDTQSPVIVPARSRSSPSSSSSQVDLTGIVETGMFYSTHIYTYTYITHSQHTFAYCVSTVCCCVHGKSIVESLYVPIVVMRIILIEQING
jgi:hypothetical protein